MTHWLRAAAVSLGLATSASAVPVDLAALPNDTVLSDQFRSIGILVSAKDGNGDPIDAVAHDFGTSVTHIFFTPDVFGATAALD